LPLTLILANGTHFGAKGYFQNVEGEFDNSTGNIAFRAKFPNVRSSLAQRRDRYT
jgi:membrane fusion protein (multidrug efflux system)